MEAENKLVGRRSKNNYVRWRGRHRNKATNTNRWRRGERTGHPSNDEEKRQQFVEREGLVEDNVSGNVISTRQGSSCKVKVNGYNHSNRVNHHHKTEKGERRSKGFDDDRNVFRSVSKHEELGLCSGDVNSAHTQYQQQQQRSATEEKRVQTAKNAGRRNDTRKDCYHPSLNFHQLYSTTQLVFIQDKMQLRYLRHNILRECTENNNNSSSLLGVSCLWPLSVPRNKAKMLLPWLSFSTRFLEVPTVFQLATERIAFVIDILKLSEDRNAMKEFGRIMKEIMTCGNLIKLVFDPQRSIDAFASTWGEYDGWEQPWWETLEPVINMRSFAESVRSELNSHSGEEPLTLSCICKNVLNLTTSGQQGLTDWGKRPLNHYQVEHAAVEARCLLDIYNVLVKEQQHVQPGGEQCIHPMHQCLKSSNTLQSKKLVTEQNAAEARLRADVFWQFLEENPSLVHEDRFKLEKVFRSSEYKDWLQEWKEQHSDGRQAAWQEKFKSGNSNMKKNPGNFRDILHSLYVDGKIKPRNNDKTILQFLDLQPKSKCEALAKFKEGKYEDNDGNSGVYSSNIRKDNKAEEQGQKKNNGGPLFGIDVSYLNFGDLEKESSKQHILSINNTSQEIQTLVAIETPEPIPGLSIAGLRGSLFQMPVNIAPEQNIQLSFTITASKCDGPVHGKVLFKFDGFEIERYIDLNITGEEEDVKPDQVSPTYVRQLKKCVVYGKAFCVRAAETLPDLPPDDFGM